MHFSLDRLISRRDSRFLLVKDKLGMMTQVSKLEQNSTKFGQSQFVTATQLKCRM